MKFINKIRDNVLKTIYFNPFKNVRYKLYPYVNFQMYEMVYSYAVHTNLLASSLNDFVGTKLTNRIYNLCDANNLS